MNPPAIPCYYARILGSFVPWGIWNERNRRRFEAKFESEKNVADKVMGQISTWLLTKKPFCSFKGTSIRESWSNLARMHLGTKIQVMKEWAPPEVGYLKLNFDGSSLGYPGIAGFGGGISDSFGNQWFSYAGPLGISDSTSAELHGLLNRLRIFKDKCSGPIHIEGDSKHQGSAAAADMELERLWLDCKRSMQMTEKWKKMYQGILDLSIDDLLDSAQSRDAKEKPRGRNRSKISSYNIKEDDPLITVKSIYKGPRD
ncbi:uncharacterized protein [Aristolochia californica]|uniref:uncharacterized protein isoform X2 n=1 Tax=Aristolochia californica TaxID=171875 RepID=UPI0035DADC37